MCMGWLSREQLEEMLSEAHDGALLVYDHNGKAHVFLPDAAPVASTHSVRRDKPHGTRRGADEAYLAAMHLKGCRHFWYPAKLYW